MTVVSITVTRRTGVPLSADTTRPLMRAVPIASGRLTTSRGAAATEPFAAFQRAAHVRRWPQLWHRSRDRKDACRLLCSKRIGPAQSLYSLALSASVIRTFRSGTFALNPASSSMPLVSGNAIWPPSITER